MAFNSARYLLLDGGLGTTLEDSFRKDISSPLWSASLIDKDEDTVVQAHKAFLEAGSDIILTATYQCSFETFCRSGYSESEAVHLMRKAISLAGQARREYGNSRNIKVALSLGPYGASMTTAQEFTGFYPPPYGPKAFLPSEMNTNAFDENEERVAKEHEAQQALEEFHFQRLKVFADDPECWEGIDFIAFETVPLAREIRAIRGAMGRILNSKQIISKPWWISTVWPDGKYPQESTPGGDRLGIEDVVSALLSDAQGTPAPDGIGVNCTDLKHLGVIIKGIRDNVILLRLSLKPFLVLYPNGGITYDTVNRPWVGESSAASEQRTIWAKRLASIGKEEQETGVWTSVAIGGCCKTGPEHIVELCKLREQ